MRCGREERSMERWAVVGGLKLESRTVSADSGEDEGRG